MSFKAHRRPEHSGRKRSAQTRRRASRPIPVRLTEGPLDRAPAVSTAAADAQSTPPLGAVPDVVGAGPLVGRWERNELGRLTMVWTRQAPSSAQRSVSIGPGDLVADRRFSPI